MIFIERSVARSLLLAVQYDRIEDMERRVKECFKGATSSKSGSFFA
jgi:hypothetical protein